MTDIDPLDRLFGPDERPSELDHLTLGYDDLSGGRATKLLTQLPIDTVKVIHRYAFDVPSGVIAHIGTLADLLEGLDVRDPNRASEQAVELAREEISGARSFFAAVIAHDELPCIGRMRSVDDLSADTAKVGWGIVDTGEDREDALKYAGLLDIMESFLADPASARTDYDTAMLAFLNDVIFRPGVEMQRG